MPDEPMPDEPMPDEPMPDEPMPDKRVTVVISGPGHHDRAEAAADLIGHLRALGRVGVHAELRPRLAADVEALLEAGAGAVRLAGSSVEGVFRDRAVSADGGRADEPDRRDELVDVEILVELVASAEPIAATVVTDPSSEPSPRADAVQQVVTTWNRAREMGQQR